MIADCRKSRKPERRAATLVFMALMVTLLMAMLAFAVDVGYILLVRTQLQVAADSSAMAAAAQLIESEADVVATAQQFAGLHLAGNQDVELNASDVVKGLWNFDIRSFDPNGWRDNAIQVTTRRDGTSGGEAPLFFAKVFGINSHAAKAEAIAGFVNNFDGFREPPSGENQPILPLALDKETFDAMLAGSGTDEWTWDRESAEVTFGPDDRREINLYPQDTGAAGNRGTVDIGNSNNSTADIARQILHGVTSEDLSHHGGSLELGADGVLELSGDPGISAGIKGELAAIEGQSRILPIFDQVTEQGSNTQYRIVQFVGVRIMEVKLTGGNKRVMVQPARVIVRGGIPSSEPEPRSHWVVSPVYLVR